MAHARISDAASLNQPLAKPSKDAEPAACASDPNSSSHRPPLAFIVAIVSACSGVVIYLSWNDSWLVAYVASSSVILAVLFHAHQVFERTPLSSPSRLHVKAGICVLATVFIAMVSYPVTTLIMPFPVAVTVWVIAGLYMFFVAEEKPNE